jgi:type 1 glutamine amidotransferase
VKTRPRHRAGGLAVAAAALWMAIGASQSGAGPAVAQGQTGKRLLLLTHNTFYNHSSLEAIEQVVPEWGKTAGFSVTSLEGYKQTTACTTQKPCDPSVADLSMIDAKYLSQFDAIMASTNGELPFTDAGKQALVDFVRNGKGIVFVHQSMVTLYGFKPWGEMLGAYMANGALFDGTNSAKRLAVMKVEDRNHPATRSLPENWTLHDEFYQFATKVWDPATPNENRGPTRLPVPLAFSRDRVHVLMSLDSEKTDFTGVKGWQKGGDYPQAWWQDYGKGRTFYTSLGHRPDLWTSDPTFKAHIVGALRWVLRLES